METADLSHHISRRFNEDLERVRSKVLAMGGLVEMQLQKAITALIEGDSSLGEAVAMDDHKVNDMEVSIDEECSRILATRAPAAGDLRLIVAIIKTITDLERIGDEGEKVGFIASRLATMERPADKYREIKHLGRLVSEMVHGALDAFARMDVQSALQIARQDRLVDEEYESIQRQCITFMMEDPRAIRRALDILWVVRALERIGDHAKNISEYVIYMVHGKDVRHTSLDDVERQLKEGQQEDKGASKPVSRPATADRLGPRAGGRASDQRNRVGSIRPPRAVGSGAVNNRRLANFLGFLACAGLMGYAYYSQYVLGFEPCPLCIFQRIGIVSLGVVFLVAALHHPRAWGRFVYAGLIGLAALATIGVAARHLYVQSLPPGSVPSCGAPLDVLLQFTPVFEIIKKVLTGGGECQEVNWQFLGLAMPAWVLISALVLGVAGVLANARRQGAPTLAFATKKS